MSDIVSAFAPVRHIAPSTGWQNDGQNYVYDRTNKVWRTWALGNPDWKQSDGFPNTSWIAYAGATLDTMKYDGVFIQGCSSLNNSFWSGSCYVDWDNHLGRGHGYAYYFVSGPAPFMQGITLLVAKHLNVAPTNLGMCLNPDSVPVEMQDGGRDFRDCRVFWDTEHKQLVLAATVGLSYVFFASTNGTDWKYLSHFRGPGSGNDLVECPNFYRIPTYDSNGDKTTVYKWVLIGAIQGKSKDWVVTGESCVAWTGNWDGVSFTPDSITPQTLDFGPDSYAAVAGEDPDGNVYFGHWLNNWVYSLDKFPEHGYHHIQSFPRKIWIQEEPSGEHLIRTMPVDVTPNRDTTVSDYGETVIGKDGKNKFTINPGRAYKVDLTLTKQNGAWPKTIDISVHDGVSNRRRYHTDLHITADGEVKFDRLHAGATWPNFPNQPSYAWTDNYSIPASVGITDDEFINLTMIVDTTSVEAFFNGGKASIAGLMFPPENCNDLVVTASDEVSVSAVVTSL